MHPYSTKFKGELSIAEAPDQEEGVDDINNALAFAKDFCEDKGYSIHKFFIAKYWSFAGLGYHKVVSNRLAGKNDGNRYSGVFLLEQTEYCYENGIKQAENDAEVKETLETLLRFVQKELESVREMIHCQQQYKE